MAYSRLVYTDNGRVITDQELSDLLTAEGFTLPPVPECNPPASPPRPTCPEITPEERAIWAAWYIARNMAYARFTAELNLKGVILTEIELLLISKFKLASWVVVGKNLNGTRKWGWIVTGKEPVTLYKSWAMALANQDAIWMICNTRR